MTLIVSTPHSHELTPLRIVNPRQEMIILCDSSGTWDDGRLGAKYALGRFETLLNGRGLLSAHELCSIVQTVNHELPILFPQEGATFSLILIAIAEGSATVIHAALFQLGLIRDGTLIAQTYAHSLRDEMLRNGITPSDSTPYIFLGPMMGAGEPLVEPPWELQPGDRLVLAYRRNWDHLTADDLVKLSRDPVDSNLADWLQSKEDISDPQRSCRQCSIVVV